MRRLPMYGLALVAVLTLPGCAPQGAPPQSPPTDAGVTPTAPLNPSLPPVGAPIVTGLRVGGAELLLTFGYLGSAHVVLDRNWYDPRTGAHARGPDSTLGWMPDPPTPTGFQDIVEYGAADGQIVDIAWLHGPVNTVTVTQHGHTATMGIAHWTVDHDQVACWVARSGTPVGFAPGASTEPADAPSFTARGADGTVFYRQSLVNNSNGRHDG